MTGWRVGEPAEGKLAYIFLAAFRGFALVVAVALFHGLGYFHTMSLPALIIIDIAGLYTLYKLLRPFQRYQRNSLNYLDLGFDVLLCLSLPILTEGLRSPFLLYSFSPVLTSALLFPRKVTFSVAGLPFLSVTGSQLLIYGSPGSPGFNPPELSASLLAVYLVASVLMAWLPYVMNINVSQGIKAQAILEERDRLSRDMHDGLAQTLGIVRWRTELLWKTVAAGNVAQSLKDVEEIVGMLAGAQREAKAVIDELHSTTEGGKGFVPALAHHATDFTRQYGIRCELHVSDGVVKLSSLAETQLLCVAQEALNNVRKHAQASTVNLSLESRSEGTEMIVRDDGQGFDPVSVAGGYGLTVMKERVKSIGGELSIRSSPGNGTEIGVKLPAQ